MNELENMSLEELSDLVKTAMSHIYSKLREEHNFGYDQQCHVTSLGSEDYYVSMYITDEVSGNPGLEWPKTWRF